MRGRTKWFKDYVHITVSVSNSDKPDKIPCSVSKDWCMMSLMGLPPMPSGLVPLRQMLTIVTAMEGSYREVQIVMFFMGFSVATLLLRDFRCAGAHSSHECSIPSKGIWIFLYLNFKKSLSPCTNLTWNRTLPTNNFLTHNAKKKIFLQQGYFYAKIEQHKFRICNVHHIIPAESICTLKLHQLQYLHDWVVYCRAFHLWPINSTDSVNLFRNC